MNKTLPRRATITALILLASLCIPPDAAAVDALLLQDTYVDNGTTGGKPPPNASNYGSGMDLRVFKGNGRVGRTFLKFSLTTLPPGTLASDVAHARLRFWVNANSTVAGSITLSPVTSAWDEYTLKDTTTRTLTFGAPKLSELPVMSVGNFVSIDVTDWVRSWLSGGLVNEGIEVEASGTTAILNLAFDSKESNQTSHEPRLEIALSRTGPPGPPGPQGSKGTAGAAGPPGATGPIGPPGTAGPTGLTGAAGPQGIAGTDGTKWFSGSGGPAQSVGLLSDYYVDMSTGDVWQKAGSEEGSMWVLRGNIRGAPGPAGSEGPVGATGLAGVPGPAGIPGTAGPPGSAGPEGAAGVQGPAGPAGPAAVWPTHILPQGDLAMGEFTHGSLP